MDKSGSNQDGDMSQFIDVDEIITSMDRSEDQRQRLATENSKTISKSISEWKSTTNQNRKELEANIEQLNKRKEELLNNSIEMKRIANLILQKINEAPGTSKQDSMQC